MANFNDRLFGQPIPAKVHNKLLARQFFAEGGTSRGVDSSLQFREVNGEQISLNEAMGTTHDVAGGEGERVSGTELSGRTPWVRMYTAVQLYSFIPPKFDDYAYRPGKSIREGPGGQVQHRSATGVKSYQDKSQGQLYYNEKQGAFKTLKAKEKQSEQTPHIYQIGNSAYSAIQSSRGVTSPVEYTGDATVFENSNYVTPPELLNNEFFKYPAGITSVSSTTEGVVGAIKKTTVNFVVNNFHDYQNIFIKYFLKPGAKIFLDFGWSTSNIYNPEEIFMNNGGKNIEQLIYDTGGIVDQSAGDLEVIYGAVINYDSKALDNGGFECSVELVSENYALLDVNITEENGLKTFLSDTLATTIVTKYLETIPTLSGDVGLRKTLAAGQVSTDFEKRKTTEDYAAYFINKLFVGKFNTARITREALSSGIYWQAMGAKSNTVGEVGLSDMNLFNPTEIHKEAVSYTVVEDQGVYTPHKETMDSETVGGKLKLRGGVSTEGDNIYISWGFFEQELLNRVAIRYGGEKSVNDVMWDSSGTYIKYDRNLLERQMIGGQFSSNKTALSFLYPDEGSWEFGETFFTQMYAHLVEFGKEHIYYDIPYGLTYHEARNKSFEQQFYGLHQDQNFDIKLSNTRLPLCELFINIKLIKDAFGSEKTVSAAIKKLLKKLNDSSAGIFDLKIHTSTRDNRKLSIVDSNSMPELTDSQSEEDFFKSLFVFKPHSPGSIVKKMDLTYQTPNNGVSSMIAIQNTSVNMPVMPTSYNDNINRIMRNISNWYLSQGGEFAVKYLPSAETDFYDMWREVDLEIGKIQVGNATTTGEKFIYSDTGEQVDKATFEQISPKQKTSLFSSVMNNLINVDDKLENDLETSFQTYMGVMTTGDPKKMTEDQNSEDSGWESTEVTFAQFIDDTNTRYEYASTIEEYFTRKIRTGSFQTLTPPLPMTLKLTIYGISSLSPGDLMRIDFLPKEYLDKIYFQIVKVSHDITTSNWTTDLECIMRILPRGVQEVLQGGDIKYVGNDYANKVKLSPKWVSEMCGVNLGDKFMEFDFHPLKGITWDGVIVLTAKARKEGWFVLSDYHYKMGYKFERTKPGKVYVQGGSHGTEVDVNPGDTSTESINVADVILKKLQESNPDKKDPYFDSDLGGAYIHQSHTQVIDWGFDKTYNSVGLKIDLFSDDEDQTHNEYYIIFAFGAIIPYPKKLLNTGGRGDVEDLVQHFASLVQAAILKDASYETYFTPPAGGWR